MLVRPSKLSLRAVIAAVWVALGTSGAEIAGAAATVTIDFTTFPDGTPIANETVISDQFELFGVVFAPLFPNSPRVLTSLGGILISGGPTGFFDDIKMEFVGLCLPTFVTIEIIGSGLNISARLEAFNSDRISLGAVTHTYTGSTGQLSPFTFFAPPGETIATVIYNGGLNPSAASIGTLIFGFDECIPIPIQIDIKPGSFPNSINPRSLGTIPVAILSSADFDALTKVDTTSLAFGRTGDEASLAFCSPSPEDVNADSLPDLVCHFTTQLTGFQSGNTEGVLKGETIDGVPIEGTDSVRIVP